MSDRKNFIFSARCRASETSFGALVAQFSNFRAAERQRERECVDRVTALESVKVSFFVEKVEKSLRELLQALRGAGHYWRKISSNT